MDVAARRRAVRLRVALQVQLTTLADSFRAATVDISRTGALFRITDGRPALEPTAPTDEPPLTAVFGGGILRRRMRVVRTMVDHEGRLSVACCFECALTVPECALIGVTPTGDESWD